MSGTAQEMKRHPRCRRHGWPWLLCSLLSLYGLPGRTDELSIHVSGLKQPELSQVRNRVAAFDFTGTARLSPRRLQKLVEDVEKAAAQAMRPYGYYHAGASGKLSEEKENTWRIDLEVVPGPPMLVVASTVELTGEGAALPELKQWRKDWPLGVGKRLDQTVWEAGKQAALDLAQAAGYLNAEFTQHTIQADLDRNEATTTLVLETGPQAVIGEVSFNQEVLKPGILELIPRFTEGQPYDSWLLEKFRLDIWRTGYFEDVDVIEERRLEEHPPRVNLVVTAKARNRNTYQGSLGFGTDTQIRAQVLWNRHLLSSRGDTLDMGLGWQQQYNEFSLKSSYRLPRHSRARNGGLLPA